MNTTQKTFFNSFSFSHAVICVSLLTIVAGCGDTSSKLTDNENSSFVSAPADTKQLWEKALAADKVNDYVTAQIAFDSLTQLHLSDDQKSALDKQRAAFGQRVWAAAERNDPAAIKAVQGSRKSRN